MFQEEKKMGWIGARWFKLIGRIMSTPYISISFICVLLLLFFAPNHVMGSFDDAVDVYLNGERLEFGEVSATIIDGRTMVPFRKLAEGIDVQVHWKSETQEIHAVSESVELTMTLGSNTANINGKDMQMSVPPKLMGDRTVIPLRYFSESFDVEVKFEDGTVIMTSPDDSKLLDRTPTLSGFYAHGYSGRSSWVELFGATFPDIGPEAKTDLFDHIHLGWFEITDQGDVTSSGQQHGFQRPIGYEEVLRTLGDKDIDRNMTIFAQESSDNISSLLTSAADRNKLIDNIFEVYRSDDYSGINLDIEELGLGQETDDIKQVRDNYTKFVDELAGELGEQDSLIVTVHPPNSAYRGYDYEALGQIADKLVVMAYDYHDRNTPSATAPIDRIEAAMEELTQQVPGDRIVLGIRIPALRYREHDSDGDAEKILEKEPLQEEQTSREWLITHPYLDSVYDLKQDADLHRHWDDRAAVSYLKFEDEHGAQNYIYFECADSLSKKWELIERYQLRGASIWRLGAVPEFIYQELEGLQ